MGRVVAGQAVFLSTAPASRQDRRIAVAVIVASLLIFLGLAPFATRPLPQVWAFIPIYELAIVISDLVTAAILFIQFNILRSHALLALACGYLFTALMAISHALTFPGLFSPTGLLGAGPQSTAWLYVFWHGGFPLTVIFYALSKDKINGAGPPRRFARGTPLLVIGAVIGAVAGLTLLATAGKAVLPDIMMGAKTTGALTAIVLAVCTLTLVALLLLWLRPRHTVLDLWLMVVMCAWLFDMALSAGLNAGRFDVGFYAGRAYGLLAATFVLLILLLETGALYAQLAKMFEAEHQERKREAISSVEKQKLADEKFNLAVETCPGGMIMADSASRIVLANSEIERMFGYRREELIGQSVDILVPQRLRAQHVRHRSRYGARPQARRMGTGRDFFAQRKDGTEFPVEIGLNQIDTPQGLHVLSVIVDITERKRLDRLKDEFVSTVSHELRTPLTSISGSLGLLMGTAADDLPERTRHLLTLAQSNSKRLVKLVNDILDIGKLESGQVTFKFRLVELRPLIEQTIDANLGFADTYLVRLRHDIRADGEVWADPDRLAQVLTNLISNAIKFSPPDGEVVVAAEPHGGSLRISVRDQGAGIPAEFKPRIFQKFAQADGTDGKKTGGTGLGLSIVKEIVGRLGGEVGFADAPGGGTIFYVELPSAEQPAMRDRPPQPARVSQEIA